MLCYYCGSEIKDEDSDCDDDEESSGTCEKCWQELIDDLE